MDTPTPLKEEAEFLQEYANTLMGSGVHTSRVIRNTRRIGKSLGLDVKISLNHTSLVISVTHPQTQEIHNAVSMIPSLPISFTMNSELSALSWEAYDYHLSLDELRTKYEEIKSHQRLPHFLLLILVGLANGSFCSLFGGSWIEDILVFFATLAGFYAKERMLHYRVNNYITWVLSAFIASLTASVSLLLPSTSEVAIATSVLYLVPGVPLLNGLIDVLEGHELAGCSRLLRALLLVICIAIGLSFTLLIVRNNLTL